MKHKRKHKRINYKPIKAKFLMLGLKRFNGYPGVWSLSPLLENTAWGETDTPENVIITSQDTYLHLNRKRYYADNIDELYTAITNIVKKYTS